MSEFKPAPIKPIVGFAALEALDIRVGTIQKVEEVPRSEKLMRLTVSFGDHTRSILAGMKKERENPREIEGKQALFVVNLEPRKGNFGGDAVRYWIRGRHYASAGDAGEAGAGWYAGGVNETRWMNIARTLS